MGPRRTPRTGRTGKTAGRAERGRRVRDVVLRGQLGLGLYEIHCDLIPTAPARGSYHRQALTVYLLSRPCAWNWTWTWPGFTFGAEWLGLDTDYVRTWISPEPRTHLLIERLYPSSLRVFSFKFLRSLSFGLHTAVHV
jgi:hypothetical protein